MAGESFFQEKRLKAFSQKQIFTLTLTTATLLTSTPDGEQLVLENDFIGGPFTINSRGLVNVGGDFHLNGNDYGSSYSCVKLSSTRVRMGQWTGATCNVK